jgi:hypothetical protein
MAVDLPPDPPPWRDEARAVQMLSTEHWSLLSARTNSWNEVFSRSGLFLNVLSAAVVALALVSQATEFDQRFALVAFVLLAVVFFIGTTTIVRLEQSLVEEAIWVVGMNRIRSAYVSLEPRLADHLVTGHHDDMASLMQTVGVPPGAGFHPGHLFVTTPGMLSVVNSVVGAAVVGAGLGAVGAPAWVLPTAAAVAFVVILGLFVWSGVRTYRGMENAMEPKFPTPTPTD